MDEPRVGGGAASFGLAYRLFNARLRRRCTADCGNGCRWLGSLPALRHNGSMPLQESPALRALIDDRYGDLAVRCRAAGVPLHDDAGVAERIRRTLLASDFAFDVRCRQTQLLAPAGLERLRSGNDAGSRIDPLKLPADEADGMVAVPS